MAILAIDPGRDKCGVAVLTNDGAISSKGIYSTHELHEKLKTIKENNDLPVVVIGDGTTSEEIKKVVGQELSESKIEIIDEKGSTLAGRELWVTEGDHSTLLALMPSFLRRLFAPAALDDFAAVVLGRRYLEKSST